MLPPACSLSSLHSRCRFCARRRCSHNDLGKGASDFAAGHRFSRMTACLGNAPTFLAFAPQPSMLANAAAPTILASAPLPSMLANAAALAILASAPLPSMLANAAAPAIHAYAPLPSVLANANSPTCLLACFDFISSAYWHRGSSVVYVWFKLNVFALTNNKGGRAV